MDIGSFVREKRRARNLSQTQLAELAGVGLNFVYQLEKNKPTVQLDCARQVLKALGYAFTVEPCSEDPVTFAISARAPGASRLPWD